MTTKTITITLDTTYDLSTPGFYLDANTDMLWIVDESSVLTSWSMPSQFAEMLGVLPEATPDSGVQDGMRTPEIRGLCADDLKEMLAMAHEPAAVELIKNR